MSEQTRSPERRRPPATGRIALAAALLGAVVFVCINLISAQALRSARIDFTEQHLYSLSAGTRTLLADLKEPLRFRLFMSSELTKQAPQLAAFAGRVRSMLDAYVAAAKGKIALEVIDPKPFSEDEDRAVAFGIEGVRGRNGERLFFGLAATDSTSGRATIESFSPDRETFLEYDLTRLVSQVGLRGKPVVALLDGIGLAGNPAMRIPEQQVLVQMKQFFDVKPLTGDVEKLPEGTRVLMVVHPQNLSQRTLYTVDQWVLNGNAAIIFVDPFAENQFGPHGEGANTASNLEALFKAWGVKFDASHAVGDPNYALQTEREVDGRPVVSQNLPWLAVRGDGLARDEAILNQLSAVVMTTAGAFETTKDGVTLRPLLQASNDAVLLDSAQAADRFGDPRRLLAGAQKSPKRPVLAARLFGTLDSAFPDGLPKDANPPDAPKPDDAQSSGETVKHSTKPLNVILVGDADMLMDRNWIRTQSMFGQRMAQAFANNGDFVINAIEQMAGGAELADLRGRGISWRPFELVQRMEAEAASRYSAKEQELTKELRDTEQKLSQLPKSEAKSGEGGGDVLTPEQLKAIEGFRTQLLRVRSELRDVQFALRRDVDNLKNWITALNVGIVPVTVAAFVLVFALRRPRRAVPKKSDEGAKS
jgi:gliding motility-associatede transport system auxiliary component